MRVRATKPKLIALHTDVSTLEFISIAVRSFYQVIPTRDPRWAMAWLGQYRDVSVFVCGRTLGHSDGLAVMESACSMRPDVLRILLTGDPAEQRALDDLERGTIQHLLEEPLLAGSLLDLVCPESVGVSASPHRVFSY